MPRLAHVPPLPHPVAARAFGWYLDRLAGRNFATVRWRCADEPSDWQGASLIFAANHSSWWDGFMAHQVSRALGMPFQILMDAKGVGEYPIFRRFGAVPVNRQSPRQAVADLRAFSGNLRPGVAAWIFPQGRRRPAGERLRGTERGAAQMALSAEGPVRIVPVGFRYPFLSEQRPEAFILVGSSWLVDRQPGALPGQRRMLTLDIEYRINQTLDLLDAALASEAVDGFEVLIRGRLSINKRMDRVRHATGMMKGPFEERNG